MKKLAGFAIAIVLGLVPSIRAIAADDEALVQILTRADIADNFTEYCAQFDPSIVQRTSGAVGNTRALALHIRDEVIAGLPFEEAKQIAIRSAQAARTGALLSVRRLYGPDPNEEHARLAKWCQQSVERDVKNYVNAHDKHHDQMDISIENAKISR
jgi:hypothetical protein